MGAPNRDSQPSRWDGTAPYGRYPHLKMRAILSGSSGTVTAAGMGNRTSTTETPGAARRIGMMNHRWTQMSTGPNISNIRRWKHSVPTTGERPGRNLLAAHELHKKKKARKEFRAA